jgi:hypothetical protein
MKLSDVKIVQKKTLIRKKLTVTIQEVMKDVRIVLLSKKHKIFVRVGERSSEVVLCPILYCRDVFSTYLGKILDFVVVH